MKDRRAKERRTKDRRDDERVTVNFPAKWHGASGGHEGRVEDLSAKGCFVNTRGAADVGEVVALLIQLPRGGWLPLRGKVRFFEQLLGFSVSFSILDDKEREALNQLVAGRG
ncbi:MAG TPA: PilZ domain-containing protein [Pyrinomonadaceae bacterium]|nr:PilZ domain-containing protein [Pyrinomonadaceae bacterium]